MSSQSSNNLFLKVENKVSTSGGQTPQLLISAISTCARRTLSFLTILWLPAGAIIACQESESKTESPAPVLLQDFRPNSMLRVPATERTRAKFPVIDVHTHFGFRVRGSQDELEQHVAAMDQHHIAMCVSLDATLGRTLDEHQRFLFDKHADRFAVFVHIDWQGAGQDGAWETWDCQRPDFPRRVAAQLAEARRQGACGLKIFKQFGLEYRNADGSLIRIDDRRWDPIWEACGLLDLPVLIHTADPPAFFRPIDRFNERYEELLRPPEWSFYGKDFPTFDELLAALIRVVARFPDTTFIGAHVASNAEDLATVGDWLDAHPNLLVDTASRIGELGRQPYSARDFCIRYQDRILFGTDGPWPAQRLTSYWRFFETRDEYFPYSEKEFPPQGFWQIYGIDLPDDVLRKIYFGNALRLMPTLQDKYDRARATMRGP
jgi:predicted TIM-barrel fold metal-dependent hydrolase